MNPANVISLPGVDVLQRATLVPLAPRDEAEAAALPAKLEDLRQRAGADQHIVLAPTHVMVSKEGQIVGYLSLNGLPTVHAWFDSSHKNAANSIKMIEHGETILRQQNVRAFAVACADESPFTPHMPRLGFHKLGTTVLWMKPL